MRIDDGMDIRPFAVDGRVQKHFFRRFEFSVQRAPRFVDLDDVLGRHFVEPLMQMPKDENPFRLGIPGTDMAEVFQQLLADANPHALGQPVFQFTDPL